MTCFVWLAVALGADAATPAKPSVRAECPALAADDFFFPEGLFVPWDAKLDRALRRWYGGYLRLSEAGSLSCGHAANGTVYRVTWVPSTVGMGNAEVHPMVVVISRSHSGLRLWAQRLDYGGTFRFVRGHDPLERLLRPSEWTALAGKLEGAAFWTAPSNGPSAIDGDDWVVEGRTGGRYHVIRRSTGSSGALGAAATAFLDAAGFAIRR